MSRTNNDQRKMLPITTWVMQSSTSGGEPTFGWSWDRWEKSHCLIPERSANKTGSIGEASFRLLRPTTMGPLDNEPVTRPVPPLGSYVCIYSGDPNSTGLVASQVLWVGTLEGINGPIVKGTTGVTGAAMAMELGHLLDRQQITGWGRRLDTAYPEAMNSPPTANMGGPAETVVGNAMAGTDTAGRATYLFALRPAQCGRATSQIWTRWRLLSHIVRVCAPKNLPPLTIACADGSGAGGALDPSDVATIAGYLNDTAYPEVYDLRNLTLKGALDMLIPKPRGLGWYLAPSRDGLVITIYSLADATGFGLPVNTPVNITLQDNDPTSEAPPIDAVVVHRSYVDLPDALVYEGAPIVVGSTVSVADNNIEAGWDAGQLTAYKTAASGVSGYASLSTTQQKERNAQVRAGPGLRDVFTRFQLKAIANGDLRRATPPITGTDQPLVPSFSWNGTALQCDVASSRCPYLPAARILRTIPWPEGVKADGTEMRHASSIANPQFLTPKVFRRDANAATNGGQEWQDNVARNGRPGLPPMQLDVDDHGPALRLQFSPPEILAVGNWTGAAVADIVPDSNAKAFAYSKLVFTIALESDQRVSHRMERFPSVPVRRTLVIRDEKLRCWAMMLNSIVGLKEDGTPDYVTGAVVTTLPKDANSQAVLVRNDFPLAVRLAKQAACFAFRERAAVSISSANTNMSASYAQIGIMIGDVIERPAGDGVSVISTTSNTVVEMIERTYGGQPRLTVSTDLPAIPMGSGASTPTGGGSVSQTLGGTVAQAVQATQEKVADLTQQTQRVPVIPPKGLAEVNAYQSVLIVGGNTLATGHDGIAYEAGGIATVPSAYDPTVTASFIDGIGRGTHYIDGVPQAGYRLIVNAGGVGSPLSSPAIAGMVARVTHEVAIPVSGGGGAVVMALVMGYVS